MGDTSKRDNSNAMTLTDIGGRGLDEEKYAPRNEQKKAKQMGAQTAERNNQDDAANSYYNLASSCTETMTFGGLQKASLKNMGVNLPIFGPETE